MNPIVPAQPFLDHAGAQRALQAVLDAMHDGEGAAVAVVDGHGELMAFARTDGCRLPSIQIAINKAHAAAREQIESKELGRRSREDGFPMTNFGDLRYPTWGGGVPLTVDETVVGAIGVSGLPEDRDIELARIGAAALL